MSEYWIEWLVTAVIILVFSVGVGIKIQGMFFGILVDSRNKMSLSRLQLFLWAWLLISAFFAVMVAEGTAEITLHSNLWALMGISLGSAAGSVLVKGAKASRQVDATKLTGGKAGSILHAEPSKKPKWSDIFSGEEVTDYKYVDIAKVQMFFITLAVWVGYLYVLWGYKFPAMELSFPLLSESLLVLIGISHAGYLTVKAAPKTPSI